MRGTWTEAKETEILSKRFLNQREIMGLVQAKHPY